MPLTIPQYRTQTTIGMGVAPRASAPAVQDTIGASLITLGNALEEQYGKSERARQEADLQDRLGRATAEIADLEATFDRDQDFRTSPDRFKAGADAIRDKYLSNVQDASVKQAFTKQFQTLALSKELNVRKAARTQESDYNVAALDSSLDTYATSAANAKNPAEREVVLSQARLAIASAQSGGWITDVDAGKRERGMLTKLDTATVIRDMSLSPTMVSTKLSLDPTYAANLPADQRERFADQAFRRADAERQRLATDEERRTKKRADEALTEAWKRNGEGVLTVEYANEIRNLVSPAEYKSLLDAIKKPDAARKDDPQTYAALQVLVESNPAEARSRALQYHRTGLITNGTLNSILGEARNIARTEGPRSPYERERAFITNAIKPSDMVPDPAASARYALAIREFDDFAKSGQRSEADLRGKAEDILKRRSMVDMIDLAQRTGVENRPTPAQTIEAIDRSIVQADADFKANKITKAERDKRIQNLNKQRQAAERAGGGR